MYRRRQVLALLIVLVPLAIIGRALVGQRHAGTPAPTVTTSTSPAATPATSTASTASTKAAVASPSPAAKASRTHTPSATPTTVDCRNSSLAVSVTTDAQSYTVGSPVTIAMRISNLGATACKRDVGALPNEVWVTDASGLVVWTSDACQTAATPQVVVMPAHSVFGNTQVWSGTNSGRRCTTAAVDAPAGSYFAHARNNTVQAMPYAFSIG